MLITHFSRYNLQLSRFIWLQQRQIALVICRARPRMLSAMPGRGLPRRPRLACLPCCTYIITHCYTHVNPFFAFFCVFFATLFYNACYSSIAAKRSPSEANDLRWDHPKTSEKGERLEKGIFELDYFLSTGKY